MKSTARKVALALVPRVSKVFIVYKLASFFQWIASKKNKREMAHACERSTFASCNSVLVVGGRGTGKSTMLDYVLQCAAPSLDMFYGFGITLPPSVPALFSSASKQWEWNRTLHPKELQTIVEQQQTRIQSASEWEDSDWDPMFEHRFPEKLPRIAVVFDDCDGNFEDSLDTIRLLLTEGKRHNFFVAMSAQAVEFVPVEVRDDVQVVVAFPERSALYRKSLRKVLPMFNTDESLLRAFKAQHENDALVFDAKAYKDGSPHLFRCNAKKLEFVDFHAHGSAASDSLGGTLPYNDGSIVDVSKLKYDPVREMYYMDLIKVEFGVDTYWADVTAKYAATKTVIIPRTDEARVVFFGTDPRPGVKKQVVVTDDFGKVVRIEAGHSFVMEKSRGKVSVKSAFAVRPEQEIKMIRALSDVTPLMFLRYLHATLTLKRASFDNVYGDVYPEQEMLVRYVPEDAHVLELGGDIGRNSCIIAALLRSSSNLVVFEADEFIAKELAKNKARNGFDFAIENNALWSSLPSSEQENHIGWLQLQQKYPWLSFDTLLAGTLYHTLQSEPELLLGFKRVLLQNYYKDDTHKSFVAEKLIEAGMSRVYAKPLEHHIATGLQHFITPACTSSFYEVWSK